MSRKSISRLFPLAVLDNKHTQPKTYHFIIKGCIIKCKFHNIAAPWMIEKYKFVNPGLTHSYF